MLVVWKIQGPTSGNMRFLSSELSMNAIAALRKASAFQVLEVIDQILVTVHKLGRLLDGEAIGVLLTKLTLVESD